MKIHAPAVLSFTVLVMACAPAPHAPSPGASSRESQPPSAERATPPAAAASSLVRIEDASTVCMVNDHHMGTPQIPVPVEGKTYYGCCKMCQARLTSDPAVRFANDPSSSKPVDKATAVLAKDASGKVLYFESEDTLRAYVQKVGSGA